MGNPILGRRSSNLGIAADGGGTLMRSGSQMSMQTPGFARSGSFLGSSGMGGGEAKL